MREGGSNCNSAWVTWDSAKQRSMMMSTKRKTCDLEMDGRNEEACSFTTHNETDTTQRQDEASRYPSNTDQRVLPHFRAYPKPFRPSSW